MSRTKKKTKTPVKKNAKSAAKKVTHSVAKKLAKKPAKKKTPRAAGKKTNSPVRKQVTPVNEKTKSAAQVVPVPEAIKPGEDLHSTPEHHEITPDRIEENKKIEELKKLEHQFEKREQVIMHQENQKMKSAMANREGRKRVFRTTRHR